MGHSFIRCIIIRGLHFVAVAHSLGRDGSTGGFTGSNLHNWSYQERKGSKGRYGQCDGLSATAHLIDLSRGLDGSSHGRSYSQGKRKTSIPHLTAEEELTTVGHTTEQQRHLAGVRVDDSGGFEGVFGAVFFWQHVMLL